MRLRKSLKNDLKHKFEKYCSLNIGNAHNIQAVRTVSVIYILWFRCGC